MPFHPTDLTAKQHPSAHFSSDPPGQWLPILSHTCSFSAKIFESVLLNLIKNPNIDSSYLFRADIIYDSEEHGPDPDRSGQHSTTRIGAEDASKIVLPEKVEIRDLQVHGLSKTRTVVRKLIPRNPLTDAPLVETCHIFTSFDEGWASYETPDGGAADSNVVLGLPAAEPRTLVIYIPHVSNPSEIPFYHPTVRALAFLHTPSTISFHYSLFSSVPLSKRLIRTATNLLATIHKHGNGAAAGYVKRVQHDRIVPQAAYQDTYTSLKLRYAKRLVSQWREVTDPRKHVFEDLGIAAFLIEVWTQMYGGGNSGEAESMATDPEPGTKSAKTAAAQERFPGFVDIGCGNGVLVDVLREEGWEGWGFDARHRKSWDSFPNSVRQENLKVALLIPEPFLASCESAASTASLHVREEVGRLRRLKSSRHKKAGNCPVEPDGDDDNIAGCEPAIHNGIFPPSTFIISNHADELTAWTPLLAALSGCCPYLIIPCCSHDLSGARFRARPPSTSAPTRSDRMETSAPDTAGLSSSAYASLVEWVAGLCADLGYEVEREALRIPSTRNAALLCRRLRPGVERGNRTICTPTSKGTEAGADGNEDRMDERRVLTVAEILDRETTARGHAGARSDEEWIERTLKLMKTQGKGRVKGKGTRGCENQKGNEHDGNPRSGR